ncbi:MAG: tyrosine-type recombinase/integrase [Chromatiales bacterium]|jgi:integrase/recombinase XerD|nr:tyrosine-type recombinase/integrase [Chromatiales bacterium]
MSGDRVELPDLGTLLQRFFIDYLMNQRRASPRTFAAYRDTFRLLLVFAERELGKQPVALSLQDLSAALVLAILEHLETERHNCVRSRNARCAAIRSFMHCVGLREPALLALTQPIIAIPMKRFERPLVGFLSRDHIEAPLTAPDPHTWSGQRDRVMFATPYNTGARVSELTGMRDEDLSLAPAPAVRIRGKGRKERCVPLWHRTAVHLRRWLARSSRSPQQPLFPNRAGGTLSRTSVAERLKLAALAAAEAQHRDPLAGRIRRLRPARSESARRFERAWISPPEHQFATDGPSPTGLPGVCPTIAAE